MKTGFERFLDVAAATFVVLLITSPIWLIGGCYALSDIEYSIGHRDGVVEKLSKKGVLWKTYEGRLILGGMQFQDGDGGGVLTAREWYFTVTDPGLAKAIDEIPPGRRVRLHYRQSLTHWFPRGDTTYFLTKIEDAPPVQANQR